MASVLVERASCGSRKGYPLSELSAAVVTDELRLSPGVWVKWLRWSLIDLDQALYMHKLPAASLDCPVVLLHLSVSLPINRKPRRYVIVLLYV
jgi:hypothetical protein